MKIDNCHILLVEDNPGDVRLIQEALRKHGLNCQLTHCDTTDAAIHLLRAYGRAGDNVPDLMLLDYNLPRGDARSVLDAALNNPALTRMRKAVVTSSISPEDRERALESGADSFIYKPADLDSFLADVGGKIAALLGRA
jgi:two-component system, chemotaxis family, response regulator Rcp1